MCKCVCNNTGQSVQCNNTDQNTACNTTTPALYNSSIDMKAVVIVSVLLPPVLSFGGRDCSNSAMPVSTSASFTLGERGDKISEFAMRWLKWVILKVAC